MYAHRLSVFRVGEREEREREREREKDEVIWHKPQEDKDKDKDRDRDKDKRAHQPIRTNFWLVIFIMVVSKDATNSAKYDFLTCFANVGHVCSSPNPLSLSNEIIAF